MSGAHIGHAIFRRVLAMWMHRGIPSYILLPFSWLFQLLSIGRYCWYRYIKGQAHFCVPIIIIGNLSLGGTGKTPLVAWVANALSRLGYSPGIAMRGYGSFLKSDEVLKVKASSLAAIVGDEPLLLARKVGVPVVIGRNRPQAISYLLTHFPKVDVIICDDGLQHYALSRDIEIAVIDGHRRLGNGFCLPAGPLRESPRRLKKVDFVVTNGQPKKDEWEMSTSLGQTIYAVKLNHSQPLNNFVGKTVRAVAGIGHPDRFFNMLRSKGINIIEHRFPDHYPYCEKDLQFGDNIPILMTEKDAVKCQQFAPQHAWCVPLDVVLSQKFTERLIQRIESGQKTVRHTGLSDL